MSEPAPTNEDTSMTKPAVASVTIWGIVFAALCSSFPSIAAALHLADPSTQAAIQGFVGQAGTLISLGVALYGRYHASTGISGVLKTPAATTTSGGPGTPPASANLVLAIVALPMLAAFVLALGACASTRPAPLAPNAAMASVTAAVQAHPGQTAEAMTAADQACLVASEGVEATLEAGVLKGVSVAMARSDLETAYKVLQASRLAYVVAGGLPSAGLQAANDNADVVYARVDAELAAS